MERGMWSDEETLLLQDAIERGASAFEASQLFDRTEASVRNKMKRLKSAGGSVSGSGDIVIPAADEKQQESIQREYGREVQRMRDAAGQAEHEETSIRSASGTRSVYEDTHGLAEDVERMWDECEKDGQRRIDIAHKKSRFRQKFDKGPIAISFISDQHIAPGTACDFKRMRDDALLIRNTPGLYACLAGDGVDNHVKIRAAVLGARSTPDEQWALFDYYLRLFAEKILVVCSGNHDAWTVQLSGVDVLKRIAEANRVRYCPAEARIDVEVGDQFYQIAFRHQYRYNSSFNQTHCVKQWFRMGEQTFDIGVIGHHHEAAIEAFVAQGDVRWAARPGSYQIATPYSTQFGFPQARPTCPTFILFPDTKKIIGFWDVRHAVVMLDALRR